MGLIRVLPEIVANKIAAGEVIERPASIVKELVENSLDAGAREVEIEIRHGGRSLIRISDNGSGMSAEDAELALERHATSKIQEADDLEHVRSFGFRGEALPSIAAVSRMTIQTRLQGQSEGVEIRMEGGKKESVQPCSCREGTVIEVRDLFFNTPARRKFLRTDPTELGHVHDAVARLGLAYPEVRFLLKSNDKTILDWMPTKNLRPRILDLWGNDQDRHLLEMAAEGTGIRVSGWITKPHQARASRSDQIFFINRRWVRSPGLGYALQDGFHGLLMHGQYPAAVLFLEIDPERVDVNVHPTKQEVRLSKESEIKSMIRRTVAECLQKAGDLAPDLKPARPVPAPSWQPPASRPYAPSASSSYLDLEERSTPSQVSESQEPAWSAPVAADAGSEADRPEVVFRDKLKVTKILGQIHHTFIVAETTEGLLLVDQHAAHERVMFESLLAEFRAGKVKRQGLLMDEMIELPSRRREILTDAIPLLEKLGFEIELFGEDTFVMRAFPAILQDEDPVACVKGFLEQKEEGKLATDLEKVPEEAAALIACKRKSVRAHDPMSLPSMWALLDQLAACENPYNCPHGRPAFFQYSFYDLERQFKRR